MFRILLITCLFSFLVGVALPAASSPTAQAATETAAGADTGIDDVMRDIMHRRCVECHGEHLTKPKGKFGYVMDLKKIAANEDYIVAGEPDDSEFYLLMLEEDPEDRMPPESSKTSGQMTPEEIATVKNWIIALGNGHVIQDPKPTQVYEEPEEQELTPGVITGRLHLLVLHFPIGLLLVAVLTEAVASRGRQSARDATTWLLHIGALTTVIATVTGWYAGIHSGQAGAADDHRIAGIVAAVLAVVTAIMYEIARRRDTPPLWWTYRTLLLLTAVIVSIAGHLGGELTHGEGFLF